MEYDSYIEEVTPRGIVIKMLLEKSVFLAFDRKGKSVYSDEQQLNVLHPIRTISFVGKNFRVRNNYSSDLSLYKSVNNEIVLPYFQTGSKKKRYIFLNSFSTVDLSPVRIKVFHSSIDFVQSLSSGFKPDYIIVGKDITRNDIIVIKNRYTEANITLVRDDGKTFIQDAELKSDKPKRAVDYAEQIDINMMSQNPVFLARIHLRELNLNLVKQLLFDFDLSEIEADCVQRFLQTMLDKVDQKKDLKKEENSLCSLKNYFEFYKLLIQNKENEILDKIEKTESLDDAIFYSTLLAKVTSSNPDFRQKGEFYEDRLQGKKEFLS